MIALKLFFEIILEHCSFTPTLGVMQIRIT